MANVLLPPSILSLDVVNWRRGSLLLFEHLAFSVFDKCFCCVLGASGVGKSSLLRLLANLTDAEDSWDQHSLTDHTGENPKLLPVYMDQDDQLLPWLNVLENITFGAKLRGQRPEIDRAEQLAARVGLVAQMNHFPHQLSGGMRQRVSLARTLYEDRPVVLLDEPFAKLDALTRHQLQDLTFELLMGKAVVMVTHDPTEAARLAQRLIVMRAGVLQGQVEFIELSTPDRIPPRPFLAEDVLRCERQVLEQLGLWHSWGME